VSSRRHASSLLLASAIGAAIVAGVLACNAITGTGKYELVDCPSGTCSDAGSGTGPNGSNGDAEASASGDGGGDSAVAPVLNCGPGQAPVTLTVSGTAGSVSARSGGSLTVNAGATQSACLVADTTEFRTSGPVADWTGASCKDGNTGRDRCEIDVPGKGVALTAALP
jgi:hypothetical protein